MHSPRDFGAQVYVDTGPVPIANTGTTENGAAIDRMTAGGRQGYMSCVLHAQAGTATGGPTTQTYDVKLQDSPDGSTGWADFTDQYGNGAVAQIAADDTEGRTNVDLSSAKRYIRVVRTVAFTGGASPDWPVAETVAFHTLEDPQS